MSAPVSGLRTMTKQNGRTRITAAFQKAQQTQTAALMPYFTLGYPDIETSLDIITTIAPHSDLLELGVPFSDPLADGPTIQHSTQVALANGVSTAVCLEMVQTLRHRGVQIPIMLMGYMNPVMAYGEARYVRDAAAAGVDGFIIPDLPPEEAGEMETLADNAGLALIHFLAPTSHPRRIADVSQRANGFIYLVSVAGVTGARTAVQTDLGAFVTRVRAQTEAPLAVGFGISTPAQAGQVGQLADGVIVGSALINAVNEAADKPAAAAAFVQALQQGVRKT
ncbi:MAG: tryptophan synthase subunit alpha [Anaerolineae bacterium]